MRVASGCSLGGSIAEMRLPNPEFDALERRPFAARKPQDEVVIVRTEPVPKEAGRHGKTNDLVVHLLELDPPEPTGENILSHSARNRLLTLAQASLGAHCSCCATVLLFPLFSFAPLRTARYT